MKKATLITLLVLGSIILVQDVDAKLLPRFSNAPQKNVAKPVSSGVLITPRLRGDRKALVVSFGNLQNARSVEYTLTYQTNGKDEGVRGSIDPASGGSASRELLFGTCSSGICRYHSNITGMKLEVTIELPSGKKTLKRYKIRV